MAQTEPEIKIEKLPNYSDKHHQFNGIFENESGEPVVPQLPNPGFFKTIGQFGKFFAAKPDVTEPLPMRKIENLNQELQIDPNDKTIKVWWLGHACNLILINNIFIITDPVLSDYASPVKGFVKRITPPGLLVEQLPKISIILYSHDHYDHLGYDTLVKLKELNPDVKILCPIGVDHLINGWDKSFNAIGFDWRTTTTIDDIKFSFFPSSHFSRRTLTDGQTKLWGSWLIQYSPTNETNNLISIYFPGDSAIGPHFQEIRQFVGKPIDLALMPVGPQNPPELMRTVHMDPQDVKDMSDILEAKFVVPIHYGTWALGHEVETPDLVLLRRAWTGDSLHPLKVGGRIEMKITNDLKFAVENPEEMIMPTD